MDDDENAAGRFRLPESFAGPDDPVEANPYPVGHPAHQLWLEMTREAQAEVFSINAGANESLTPETAHQWMQTLVVAKFDAWAKRSAQFVSTDQDERQYALWLVGYANIWIEAVAQLLVSRPPPFSRDAALVNLRNQLGARVHHWRAEAHRHRVNQEAHAAAAAPPVRPRPSADLVKRRWAVIRKHRDAHGRDAIAFANFVGISDTAIRGIVREDRKRFDDDTQERLLKALSMTREEWYRE